MNLLEGLAGNTVGVQAPLSAPNIWLPYQQDTEVIFVVPKTAGKVRR
jgi:hypothetical protein